MKFQRLHTLKDQLGIAIKGVVLIIALVACALTELAAPAPAPTPSAVPTAVPTVALTNNASTFDHNSLVGQSASSFTLMDATGQPYTFTPNDGRKHVIVFYMGYG
jgi:cytochrome oxidase Cu insertion factor (SCO1/SenC/PrrC family)